MLDQMEMHHILILLSYVLICIWALQRIRQEKQKIERDRLRQEALEAPYAPTQGHPTRLSYTPEPLPDRTERPADGSISKYRYRYRYVLEHRNGRAVWKVNDYNQVQKHATSAGSKHAIAETLTTTQLYFN